LGGVEAGAQIAPPQGNRLFGALRGFSSQSHLCFGHILVEGRAPHARKEGSGLTGACPP